MLSAKRNLTTIINCNIANVSIQHTQQRHYHYCAKIRQQYVFPKFKYTYIFTYILPYRLALGAHITVYDCINILVYHPIHTCDVISFSNSNQLMTSIYFWLNLQAPVLVSISLTWRFYIHFQLAVFGNDKRNKDITTSKADETKTLQLDDAEGTIEQEEVPEFLEWDEDKSADEQSINCQLKASAKSVFFCSKISHFVL